MTLVQDGIFAQSTASTSISTHDVDTDRHRVKNQAPCEEHRMRGLRYSHTYQAFSRSGHVEMQCGAETRSNPIPLSVMYELVPVYNHPLKRQH